MSDQERPLRLLSLDGGGIRGLSSLYIIRNLMVAVQRLEQKEPVPGGVTVSPRPCDYFDMIAGTSTGGLIAVMLGLLRMDIQTCIDAYLQMAPQIFPIEGVVSGSIVGRLTKALGGHQRFDPGPLEAAIKSLVVQHLGNGATGDETMRSHSNQACKVFVCVTSEEPRRHFRFRTYESPTGASDDMAIWQACRATSAAPTFFPPVSFGNPPRTFVDGGLGYNNPTQALREEATHLWPSRDIGCIVSIGTGMVGDRDVGRSLKPLFETLQTISTDTEKVAREVKEEMDYRYPDQDVYFRFNVQHGLQTVSLEEWKEMGRIQTVTEDYLHENWRWVEVCASRILSIAHPISLASVQKIAKTFSNIPFPRDPDFIGRKDILEQVGTGIADPKSKRWASLYGLGGIGKSQIAIEYSYRQKEQSPQISTFWVHASSKARFEQSYAEIATEIEIPGVGDGKVDILKSVSTWLSNKDRGPWLLILDNVDDDSVLLDLSTGNIGTGATLVQRRLLDFLPRVEHGAVLITTRDRTCAIRLTGHRGTPIEVLAMNMDESVDLLRNTLTDAPREEASELVKELEYVPLAISQASAYINTISQVSILTYLSSFRRSNEDQAALLNKNEYDLRRDPGVPNAVITSWQLSFNQILEKSPGSAGLLSLMSYFNRQAIPKFLIQGDVGDITFDEDIDPLLSFSLIRAEIREHTYEMHRLVQTAMRHWLRSQDDEQSWRECAIKRVASIFPSASVQAQRWPVCEALMSHADEVIEVIPHTTSSRESQLSRATILVKTAYYLIERKGYDSLAEQRSTSALKIQRNYLDENSKNILVSLSTLAYAQIGLGKFDEAMGHKEYVLKQNVELHGSENGETLSAMHNLALSHDALGQFEKAEDLLRRVIEVRERLLGPEHPETLVSVNQLANIQTKQGKYEEAEKLSAKVLETSKRCLGVEHLRTLLATHHLSLAYVRQNKFKEAEGLTVEAIPLLTKTFGSGHWRILQSRAVLAEAYWRQGKLEEAKEVCISCLDTAQGLGGADDQVILNIAGVLGLVYRDQGRFIDALRSFKSAVESTRKALGADHPGTLISLHNLATCYYDMGDKDRAVQMMTDVLRKKSKVLRADHPDIANSAKWLAIWKSMEEESEGEGSEKEESEEEGSEEEGSEEEDGGGEEESEREESKEVETDELKTPQEENEEGKREQEGTVEDNTMCESSPAAEEAGPRWSPVKKRRKNY